MDKKPGSTSTGTNKGGAPAVQNPVMVGIFFAVIAVFLTISKLV